MGFAEGAKLEQLLRLVIDMEGYLNPHLVKGICERFIQSTHMHTLFYRWMLVVVQKAVQDLVANVQKGTLGYQVDAHTAQVVQAPVPSYKHSWLSSRGLIDNPEGRYFLYALDPL